VHRRGVKRRIEHKSTDHSQLEPRRSEKAIKMEKKWRLHGYLNRDHLFFWRKGEKKYLRGKKQNLKMYGICTAATGRITGKNKRPLTPIFARW
jgi:hypothetical protein